MKVLKDRGFGLLELLLVIVVISVLAGIAIAQYRDTRARSLDAKVESAVRHVATGQEAYYANRQHYTSAIEDLDTGVPSDVAITLGSGNSGDLGSSFRVRGTTNGAAHAFVWVSDPLPGEPNIVAD